jgi:thymidylate synthase (FAD)
MAGRTAYKSEDHITEDSAKKFVKMLKNRNHGAALEHGTCYLNIPKEVWNNLVDDHDFKFMDCPYQWFGYSGIKDDYIHLTTNYRVLVEHGYEALLDGMIEPTEEDFEREIFKRRITVKFICDRGVSHEFCRHRVFSFLMESTRYCNYSKDKFGNQITFIIPRWIHDIQEEIASTIEPTTGLKREYFRNYKDNTLMSNLTTVDRTVSSYVDTLQAIEDCYLDMTMEDGLKPQQARQILPNCLKTELVMTGTIEQWKHFFDLRCATSAHPDARHLAVQLKEQFLNKGYLK